MAALHWITGSVTRIFAAYLIVRATLYLAEWWLPDFETSPAMLGTLLAATLAALLWRGYLSLSADNLKRD